MLLEVFFLCLVLDALLFFYSGKICVTFVFVPVMLKKCIKPFPLRVERLNIKKNTWSQGQKAGRNLVLKVRSCNLTLEETKQTHVSEPHW
jgi:hypothetical protein